MAYISSVREVLKQPPSLSSDYNSALRTLDVLLNLVAKGRHWSVYFYVHLYGHQLDRFNLLELALRRALEQHQMRCAANIMECMGFFHWWYVGLECVRLGVINMDSWKETVKSFHGMRVHMKYFHSATQALILLDAILLEKWHDMFIVARNSPTRITPGHWSVLLIFAYYKGDLCLARCLQQHVQLRVDQKLLKAASVADDRDFVIQALTDHIDTDTRVDWDDIMWHACLMGHGDFITAIAHHRQMKHTDNELVLACATGDMLAVQHRLTHITNERTWYCYLSAACLAGHAHVCDVLIEYSQQAGLDFGWVVRSAKNAVQWAHYINKTINTSTIDFIENKLGEVFAPDLTCLHRLCYEGESLIIHRFTTFHPNILEFTNTAGYHGYSPLHVTVLGENNDMEKIVKEFAHIIPIFKDIWMDKLYKPSLASLNETKQHLKIVHFLLHHGAFVDCRDIEHRTPVHLAAISGSADIIPILLDAGADINARDAVGMTPVSYSSQKGHYRIVEYLIKRKCDVTITNIYGQTPLHLSSQHNHVQCVELLVLHPDLINHQDCDGNSALSLACSAGHSHVVEVLLQHRGDPQLADKDGQLPLHKAAMYGWTSALDKLIMKKVNLDLQDNTGSTALHLAISSRKWKAAMRMIKAGCNINLSNYLGNTPFQNIVIGERQMTKSRIQDNILSKFLKIEFASGGSESNQMQYDLFDQFLPYKYCREHKNNCGDSAMMQATNMLNVSLMNYLADNGADMHTTDNLDRGLIHTVVTSKYHGRKFCKLMENEQLKREYMQYGSHTKIVFYIMDDKIEIALGCTKNYFKKQKKKGRHLVPDLVSTAFDVGVLEFLLSKDVNINKVDHNGHNALHLAAQSGNLMATKWLLHHGADFTAEDKFGFTPLMLALSHDEVFNMLWDKNKSFLPMTECHFSKLRILAHWKNNDKVKDVCNSPMTKAPSISNLPREFIYPSWSCNRKFTVWFSDKLNMKVDSYEGFLHMWPLSFQKLTYVHHEKIIRTLQAFIEDILRKAAKLDPLMACMFRLSGSERERAKVIATNEIDSLCVLLAITFEKFELPSGPSHHVLKEFVSLKCKKEYMDEFARVLDSNGYLSRSKLFQNYGAVMSKVLADPALWEKYANLQRISCHDITAGISTITPLMVRWHDSVYAHLDISIDMVPAIDLPTWRPSWASTHPLLDILQILIVPKWKATAVDDDTMLEVGVSHWGEVFEQMPNSMLQGYRLAKVVKELCPQISDWHGVHIGDLITSYMLKMTIVKQYAATLDAPDQPSLTHSDLHWARRIYASMESSFRDQYLGSFFIPKYNLLYDDKFVTYREAAIAYCQLCLKLLMPTTVSHMRKAYMGINEV